MPDETMIARITGVLRELNQAGGFAASVLTDDRGLALASAASAEREAQTQAAVAALVERAAGRVADQMGMAETQEVSVSDAQGRVLICRRFEVSHNAFVLSVVLPHRRLRYRSLTGRAVRSLQRILESL